MRLMLDNYWSNCRLWITFGVLILCAPSVQTKADEDLAKRFFTEAPLKWKEYLTLATHLEGTFAVKTRATVDDKIYDEDFNGSFAINGNMARINRTDEKTRCYAINPKYRFKVSANGRDDKWTLSAFKQFATPWQPPRDLIRGEDKTGKYAGDFLTSDSTTFGDSMGIACQGMLLCGAYLPRLISAPGFSVKQVTRYGENRQMVKVQYEFNSQKSTVPTRSGVVVLDTEHYWLISEAEFKTENLTSNSTGNIHFVNEYDTTSKFPYVRKKVSHYSWLSAKGEKGKVDYTWTAAIHVPSHMDEKQFALSAFGFPEPQKKPPLYLPSQRKTPLLFWFAMAGLIACVVVFIGRRIRR